MKTKKYIIALFPVLLNMPFRGYSADPASKIPYGLTVEFIREPEKTWINNSLPLFGWIVPDEAVSQKAYQILVSSGMDLKENSSGNIWNSGRVKSSKSINIGFSGIKLKENSTYFWKVRIWDHNDHLSEYSRLQVFRTGLFGRTVSSPNIFQVDKISPVSVSVTGDGSFLFDFGKDAFGTIELQTPIL